MENHGREKWHSKAFRIFNSALCFASAYLLLHSLHWVIVAFAGSSFDLNAFIYYHGVKFLMNGHKWDRQIVVLTYITGPLFAVAVGLAAIFIFSRIKTIKSIANVFLLWVYVVGLGMFLSQGVVASLGVTQPGSAFYIDWAPVLAWLQIPALFVYALNIPFLVLILYFGTNTAKPFLLFAYSFTKVNKLDRRRKYFAEVAIVPFIIGAAIALAVGFPIGTTAFAENFLVHGIYLLIISMMLGVAYFALPYINIIREDLLKYKSLQELNVFIIILLVLIIAVIKVTWGGIYL